MREFPHVAIEDLQLLTNASFYLARAEVTWDAGITTLGWGRDHDWRMAQVKGMAEAVERFAWQRCDGAQLAQATDLDSFLPPRQLIAYADEQYRQPGFPFAPFHENDERWWLPAQALAADAHTWVLADCICGPRAFDTAYRTRLVTHATTSGFASAPRLAQAMQNAALELIERDAFMRHWFAQQGGHVVLADTLPDGLRQRMRYLEEGGCRVQAQCLDMGCHLVWLVLAQHIGLHFTCVGAASGLDAESALEAALSELETQALTRLEGVPPEAMTPEQVRSPADHGALYATGPYFQRADALLRCQRQLTFSQAAAGFAVTPAQLYARMASTGHEPYWLDRSVPGAPALPSGEALHSVRVVAPGLIPLTFGNGLLPLGMDQWQHGAARFPHPFN